MATHIHSYAYKSTATCSVLAKEGDDAICTETIKHYYNSEGLENMRTHANNVKEAETVRDGTLITKAADDVLAEIAAVQ